MRELVASATARETWLFWQARSQSAKCDGALKRQARSCTERCSHAREFQQTGSGVGGARRDRTDDLLLAKQALSQLSYGPFGSKAERSQRSEARRRSPLLDSDFWLPVSESLTMVGLGRLELPTSRLSGVRSNRLSYRPDAFAVASCLKKEKRRRRNPALSLDPVRFLRPVRCLGRADMASVRAHP